MELKKEMIIRTIAGETMLIPVGSSVGDFNGIFTLTPSAAVAFRAISEGKSEKEIISLILDEFDVDEETAKKDLEDFLTLLRNYGII